MKHDFLDRHADLDSPIHRVDPRAKLLGIGLAIALVASEPPGELLPFAAYYPALFVLLAISRIPASFFAQRVAVAAPFVLAAALALPLSSWLGPELDASPIARVAPAALASSLALRAFAAVLLLTLLGSSGRFHELLWGLRRFGMPGPIGALCALVYRYAFILTDETLRTTMARVSRTPGRLATNRFVVFGHQTATVFLRGWQRAQRVHGAMLSRGFTGEFPLARPRRFRFTDGLFALVVVGFCAFVRFTL
jgi:cobalt/nickel transport system permease protein